MVEEENTQSQTAAEVGRDEALKSKEEKSENPSRRFNPSRSNLLSTSDFGGFFIIRIIGVW